MKITNLKTNHLVTPLGYDYKIPTFSWTVEDTLSKKATATQVEVATDKLFTSIVYDSGDAEINSVAFTPDFTPDAATRYYWRVTVTGDQEDTASEYSWFETPPWGAKFTWITPEWEDPEDHPYLRKAFTLPAKVKTARAYASGLGIYHLEINGKKAGDEYLTPGYHSYDSWMQYQTYDITDYLTEGENAIGAMLGKGWAKGRLGLDRKNKTTNLYVDQMAFVCKLVITCEDGSIITLDTDKAWKCAPSPTLRSEIYDGEIYDAVNAIPGWSSPGLDDSSWSGVNLHKPPVGPLTPRLSPPIKIMHTFNPKELITTPKGDKVIDIGQIISGWLRFNVNAPKGAKISMYHGEIMQNDEFYNDNLRSALSEYHYISDGNPATVDPMFTFHGYRFVKIEGWPGEINLDDFTACAIYSDLEATGSIETSDPLVNRLFLNCVWGQRDNFVDVPTDCPQRDERLGWTGDAQVFAGTASFNMDTAAFYHKFMKDVYSEQLLANGAVPYYAPVNKLEGHRHAACGWADAAAVIPWVVYTHYGDKALLKAQYPSMKAWCEWIINRGVDVKTGSGWLADEHFGDWLALDGPGGTNPQGGTEKAFLAAAYATYSTHLTAKAAEVLGYTEDVYRYKDFSEKVKADIREEYFTKTGRGALPNQTFYVLSLFMDLVPPEARERVLDDFVKRLEADNMHLKTGFLGTPLLCRVLSDNGRGDLAYKLFLNDDLPSWLYEVKMGATTVWERWNSVDPNGMVTSIDMNSLNHYAYGSVIEWMYRHMCGIKPTAPGFKEIEIKPELNKHFTYVKAEYKSAAGVYRISWEIIDDDEYVFNVTVPFGATASLTLPNAKLRNVRGIINLESWQVGTGVWVRLEAGDYRFKYMFDDIS